MNEVYCPECQEHLGYWDLTAPTWVIQQFVCKKCRLSIELTRYSDNDRDIYEGMME